MKIAILSDTHIRKHPEKIIKLIDKHFKNVDMIIHAGDYISSEVVSILKKHKNFIGVWGNNDNDTIKSVLKEKELINLKGYRVGIYHGHGSNNNTANKAYEIFSNDKVDIIIFGHSHKPIIFTKNKTLMINPGSFTYKRKERWHSYVILEIEKDTLDAYIKFFN